MMDMVIKRFPHTEQLAGIRILDKSQPGRGAIRLEIWTKFSDEFSE